MTVEVRPAGLGDAGPMSEVLTGILDAWDSPRPRSPSHVRAFYIQHPDQVASHVALIGDRLVGFQSLKVARKGNIYDLPLGWGIIGTYVARDCARQGVGRALFAATLAQARAAGMLCVDATIEAGNAEALAYYEAMGFQPYRTLPGAVGARLTLGETG